MTGGIRASVTHMGKTLWLRTRNGTRGKRPTTVLPASAVDRETMEADA